MMLIAGGLYFCALKLTCAIFDQQLASGEYNSLDTALSMSPIQIIYATWHSYWDAVLGIILMPSIYSGYIISIIHIIILLCPIYIVLKQICSTRTNVGQKILIILLLAITPLCMNICQVLTNNMSHNLMHYAFWLTYLFVLLIFQFNKEEQIITHLNFLKWGNTISISALVVLLIWQVRLANLTYFVKDIENRAVSSFYTRVIYDIEKQKDYMSGETKIALIGAPYNRINENQKEYYRAYALMGHYWAIGYCKFYLTNYLMYPANFTEAEETNRLAQTEAVVSMPNYPAEGSIQMIDNILVVKFS